MSPKPPQSYGVVHRTLQSHPTSAAKSPQTVVTPEGLREDKNSGFTVDTVPEIERERNNRDDPNDTVQEAIETFRPK